MASNNTDGITHPDDTTPPVNMRHVEALTTYIADRRIRLRLRQCNEFTGHLDDCGCDMDFHIVATLGDTMWYEPEGTILVEQWPPTGLDSIPNITTEHKG